MVAERKLQRLGPLLALHPEDCPRADLAAGPWQAPLSFFL